MEFSASDVAAEVGTARERIRPWVRETPLERSPYLSKLADTDVWLKMENLQVTQSFKARGAFNALLSLSAHERERGVVTSSTGNHANACAYAMPLLDIEGEIWVPSSTSRAKLDQLRAKGAQLKLIDDDPGRVEMFARAEAEASGRTFVSPYNDPKVIGGQGTIAAEVVAQMERAPDAILAPVGGGGLMAGISGWLKASGLPTRAIGCQPANSPVFARSVEAGELLEPPWEPSLSDATVGWAEPGAISFPICRDCVDEWIEVSEAEIADAIRAVVAQHSVLVEGAGALAVACLLAASEQFAGQSVVLILSGARIPADKLARVLAD